MTGAAIPALRPAALRPTLSTNAHPSWTSSLVSVRYQSNVPQQDPKSRAQAILDALPGSNLASKTAILSGGAGLSIAAISNEIYVLSEETIVMVSFLTVVWAIWNYLGPSYRSWAESHNDRVRNILDTARENHKTAVQSRIDSVKSVGGVVDVTKDLFAVSKVRRS